MPSLEVERNGLPTGMSVRLGDRMWLNVWSVVCGAVLLLYGHEGVAGYRRRVPAVAAVAVVAVVGYCTPLVCLCTWHVHEVHSERSQELAC